MLLCVTSEAPGYAGEVLLEQTTSARYIDLLHSSDLLSTRRLPNLRDRYLLSGVAQR